MLRPRRQSRRLTSDATRRNCTGCEAISCTLLAILSASELSYHQSLEVARSQSAKLLELRASTRLARLWRKRGKRAEARDLLGPIYNWFTEGFGTPSLDEAKALLEELAL